ncbi:MAG: prolyl aminopeptidase [Alphaproteobacteria bacterium]|nr:prolyl aminopeptidase [Alphaproteobacteria bacterium]
MDNRTGTPSRTLYPSLSPFDTGWMDVGDGHSIWWEACGNPRGKPALFLHGGPGGSCQSDHRRLFDPETYCIVLFDQRGAGRSSPKGWLQHNTTAHLVADIEKLRLKFGFADWLVLGGSWGAALALAYAQAHPACVRALVLRGVFTARQSEVGWLYKFGASQIFPGAWQKFESHIPQDERDDLVAAYHRRLAGADEQARRNAARAWCAWESELLTLMPRAQRYIAPSDGDIALARIEAHYFVNRSFMSDGEIIANLPRIAHIPGVIVQGRYDVITPPATAHELAASWPAADLKIIPDAGHATSEPGIMAALVEATDRFRTL